MPHSRYDMEMDMTEETGKDETPMTAQDVQIQELRSQMDALKADYDKQLKSYQDANRQLYAMLNQPIESETITETETEQGFDMDACAKAFYNRIDKKNEE